MKSYTYTENTLLRLKSKLPAVQIPDDIWMTHPSCSLYHDSSGSSLDQPHVSTSIGLIKTYGASLTGIHWR
jgi:hypothetical protein